MKPGVVFPNPLAGGVADLAKLAEAGVKGILSRPEAFVDAGFGLKVDPDALAAAFTGSGIELVGVEAVVSLLDSGHDTAAGIEHISKCLDLADALREYASEAALPSVVFDAGPGDRNDFPRIVEALKALASAAEERQVLLALRPSRDSAIDRSRNALGILTEVAASYVQIALDAAAIMGDKDTLDAAVDRLKQNIVIAYARDVQFDASGCAAYPAPGGGMMNYPEYAQLLAQAEGCGYLVVGRLDTEADTSAAIKMVSGLIA